MQQSQEMEVEKNEINATPEELQYQELYWALLAAQQQQNQELKGYNVNFEEQEWIFSTTVTAELNHQQIIQSGLALVKSPNHMPKHTLWIGRETINKEMKVDETNEQNEEEHQDANEEEEEEEETELFPESQKVQLLMDDIQMDTNVITCSRKETNISHSGLPDNVILIIGQDFLRSWNPIDSQSMNSQGELVFVHKTNNKRFHAKNRFQVNTNDLILLQNMQGLQHLEQGILQGKEDRKQSAFSVDLASSSSSFSGSSGSSTSSSASSSSSSSALNVSFSSISSTTSDTDFLNSIPK